ncbi:hypothetical protein GCM10023187_08160 [Nibrella viscosa]|uniref:Polymerase beta nucleotidyltransferase domain-containing protein n=1 Tax=Nibrella viscosa TaxID=1084524 RepID=A0ABP8JYW3_9BACT
MKRAYLFGSAARGKQPTNSDVDILAELDYEQRADFYQFLAMQEPLSVLLNKPVDLVSTNGLSPVIQSYIEQEKQLIYEKAA